MNVRFTIGVGLAYGGDQQSPIPLMRKICSVMIAPANARDLECDQGDHGIAVAKDADVTTGLPEPLARAVRT